MRQQILVVVTLPKVWPWLRLSDTRAVTRTSGLISLLLQSVESHAVTRILRENFQELETRFRFRATKAVDEDSRKNK